MTSESARPVPAPSHKRSVPMVSALDVASYILARSGQMTAMKLQKLVYYCQAWSLVWDDKPMFHEKIEAWINGPVIPQLFDAHRGQYGVNEIAAGDPRKLSEEQKETIKAVLKFYGTKSSQWLSELTHKEAPWRKAREKAGLTDRERGNAEITHEDMYEYYDGLVSKD